jgi:DNA-binding SARP family transcriptional activator
MDFRILGPLEVYAGDVAVPVGGAKPRALLAILLLHANEVVSNDRLIEALWAGQPPETALKALQVHVSQLRKAIGASAIHTRPPGYMLDAGPDEFDLHRFQRLHEEARGVPAGDPAEVQRLLRKALALWRGPVLADFAYEPFAQAEIARLEEAHIDAIEDRVEADLALGRHADVIGELESCIGDYPLRERLRAQLMLALYRSGRQAEALDAFRDARAALTGELGIEPGRDLRNLQQAILSQASELDLRPVLDAVPSDQQARGVFVGREREVAELARALEDALASRGRVVLLVGEPGIGKSWLADELMRRATARGTGVLVGRCWEAGGAPAYWPWSQSLRAYVRAADPDALRTQLGAGAAELSQLLPELRELLPDVPEVPSLDSEGARFRLFEAVSSFLRSATQAQPLVVVLDDLHSADEPSLLLLRFIARQISDSRLLVLCAFRDVDPVIGVALASMVAELTREPHVGWITLAGLSEGDLAEYIELSTGIDPPPRLVAAIQRETEGNPLFVAETVRLLSGDGRIGEADAHFSIPPGVRAVIGQRVRRLSERCQEPLVLASVMGREFGLDALARLVGHSREELLDILDEAMAERVVGIVPGSPGRLRFGHALIRDTLYDELTMARKLRLHRAVGEALEAVYSADLEPHLAELAQHFMAAAPAGETGKAVEYARRAGDLAASQLAYEEAVRLYDAALSLIDDPFTRSEVLLTRGDAQARAGETAAASESFRKAAKIAAGRGLTDHLVRAALGYGGRLIWEASRDDDLHRVLLERALAALGEADSTQRVMLLARLAGGPLRVNDVPLERRSSVAQEAVDIARRLGDPGTLAYALSGYTAARHAPDHTRQQVVVTTELIDVSMRAGDLERAAEGHEHRCAALIELGSTYEAKADLTAMAELARELRQPSQDWFVGAHRALRALLEARFSEAEDLIADARALGERAESWNAVVTYGLQLYLLRREQGRLPEVEELVRRSAEEYPTYPIWRCVLASVAAELGDEVRARHALGAISAHGFASLPFNEEWLVSMALLTEAAVALGDVERASLLYAELLPYCDRVAISPPEISTGSVARNLGLLAAAMERWGDAEGHFEDALEMNERIGARSWLAHTERDYAHMLLTRDAHEDSERAARLVSRAQATYRELGMESHARH